MSVYADTAVVKYEDGTFVFQLSPPTSVRYWDIRFRMSRRAGGSDIILKSCASGYNNVSGINVTDFTDGVMNTSIYSVNTSGLDESAYYYTLGHYNSGVVTLLARGYVNLTEGLGKP